MKKPLVVIVGRPNVGKSTFFNRLVGRRDAIVDDLSGVTRDRNYGEVEWAGKHFRLIDTGGFVPDSIDQFETAIREQVKIALEESDSIIFIVDVKTGINPMDSEILIMLRNSNKKFYVVVNKVDNKNLELSATEFYQLGIEKYYDISATMGRNIGDFLDVLTEDFVIDTDEVEDERLKIAIVGRPNVGKSSLTNALLGYDRSIVTYIPGTTRDSIDSILKYYGKEIVLIDTAGLRKKKKVKENIEFFSNIRSLKAIGDCDIAIVMLDAQFGLEKQDQKIIDEAIRWRKGVIISVNKWDLIEKETNTAKEMSKKINYALGSANYIPIVYSSALTKQRIYKLIDIALEIEERRKKKISTNVLNDTLLPEINKTPPPSTSTGKEIKIKFISQVGSNYPVFLFFTNYPKYVPTHYIKFLENLIRKNFGYFGVPITLSFKEK
ncbi:MAG: ribosome biogenesis GTPase Der [Ignavibacteriales bacterium CG_4_9_14_3_um_filter_30_11]|nr:MAG: ribosome biogenesis GTPase Der [Ignavibacteriales bacterium CG_4_9_14_3_um_filter_30_11]